MVKQYKYNTSALDRTIVVMDQDFNILEIQNPECTFLTEEDSVNAVGKNFTHLFNICEEGIRQHRALIMDNLTQTRDKGKHSYFEYTFDKDDKIYYAHGHIMADKKKGLISCSQNFVEESDVMRPREQYFFEQLNLAIDHINAGIFVVHGRLSDREDVSIYSNKRYKNMFDCPSGDPRDTKKWDHETCYAHDNILIKEKRDTISYETVTRKENGEIDRIYDVYKQLYFSHEDSFTIVTTVTDITNLRNEISLRKETTDRFEEILRRNRIKLWEYNFQTERFTAISKHEIGFGFETLEDMAAALIDRSYKEVAHKFKQLEKGDIDHHETTVRLMSPAGEMQYVNIVLNTIKNDEGKTIKVDAISQIVTEAVKKNEKLRQTTRINELIVNNVNADLYFFNIKSELVWKNTLQNCPQFNYKRDMRKSLLLEATDRKTIREDKMEMEDGQILLCTYIPVINQDMDIVDGMILSVKDVTEHEKTLNALRTAKYEAETSGKMKTAFLKNITHEIRTPLNSIQGFSQLICENDVPEEDKKELFGYIKDSTDSLVNLVNNLIDLSSLDAGISDIENNWFNVDTLFREIYFSLCLKQDQISSKVKFFYNEQENLKCMLANSNRKRVLQVVRNFCTNALKFTNVGFVEMGYDFRDGGLYVYVKDTGIGLTEENRQKVFNRFEKFGSYKPGTGIGLTICKAIMNAMGGYIGNIPNTPQGSIFYAWFPCEVKKDISTY